MVEKIADRVWEIMKQQMHIDSERRGKRPSKGAR